MNDENEIEFESWKEIRQKEIGFKAQREIYHNFYLPYSYKLLDNESNALLRHIKRNLGIAIAYREIHPATGIYITKLLRYIYNFLMNDIAQIYSPIIFLTFRIYFLLVI